MTGWIRHVSGWGAVILVTLGSGPCPGCIDDECSPKGETYCQDNVAYLCVEPNDNGAYALLDEDCAETNQICALVDVEGDGVLVATCVDGCQGDAACGDASVCMGDACVSEAPADGGS